MSMDDKPMDATTTITCSRTF